MIKTLPLQVRLDQLRIHEWVMSEGWQQVYRSWRHTMMAQRRPINVIRQFEDSLPLEDKVLDMQIALDVVMSFLEWINAGQPVQEAVNESPNVSEPGSAAASTQAEGQSDLHKA